MKADLDAAISMLDSEEHRYVERYHPCPAGCMFDITGERRIAGPADCTDCEFGCAEDEDARHLDAFIARLRDLSEGLIGLAQAMEVCPVHLCDAAICADDRVTECATDRGVAV